MTKVVGIDAAGQRVELKFVQLETPNIWVSMESDDICEQYTHCKKPVRCLMAEPIGSLRFLITRDRCVFNGSSVASCPAGRLTMRTALPLSCPQAATAVLALPATSVTTSTSGYTGATGTYGKTYSSTYSNTRSTGYGDYDSYGYGSRNRSHVAGTPIAPGAVGLYNLGVATFPPLLSSRPSGPASFLTHACLGGWLAGCRQHVFHEQHAAVSEQHGATDYPPSP